MTHPQHLPKTENTQRTGPGACWLHRLQIAVSLFFALTITSLATADEKLRQILLYPQSGDPVNLGTLQVLQTSANGHDYRIVFNETLFSDHFLSMRPFKCFQGAEHMLCHLPYPYPKSSRFSEQAMTDLEYDLLFIHRQAEEYGINPWNGIYYRLSLDQSSGNISGELYEVDLNILAAPPEEGVIYPITQADLVETDPSTHSFPELRIE